MFSDGARTLRDHRIERGPGRFGNIVTPLEMQQEHRSFVYIEIRSFVYICIAAGEVVQDPTLLQGRSVRCRSALRRRADNPRAAWQPGHRRTRIAHRRRGFCPQGSQRTPSPATFSVRRGPGRGEDFEGTP
jgi:hypothetical protein